MSGILDNFYIDRVLLRVLSQIYSQCIRNCTLAYFLKIMETCFFKNVFSILLFIYFIQKPVTSITEGWLVVESCPTPQSISFFMFCRLVCNISYHLNDLVLAWSALLQWRHKVSASNSRLVYCMNFSSFWNRQEL